MASEHYLQKPYKNIWLLSIIFQTLGIPEVCGKPSHKKNAGPLKNWLVSLLAASLYASGAPDIP